MGKLERLAIVVALAAAGLAVVAAASCGSVEALTDAGAGGTGGGAAGQAAGAGGSRGGAAGGAGDVGGRGGSAGDVGQADAGDAGDVGAQLVACGVPVRNVGATCAGVLSCATCVGAADSAPRYDCRGSISGAPVYCFPAGVPADESGCQSCP